MRILVVSNYKLYDPVESSFVHHQVKEYVKLGHQVKVLVPIAFGRKDSSNKRRWSCSYTVVQDGVEIIYLRYLSFSNLGEPYLNQIGLIAAFHYAQYFPLRDFKPDIIHSHTFSTTGSMGAWLKRKLHCPLVVTTHGSDTSIPYEQGRFDWLAEKADLADHVVAVSSALAKKLADSGTKTPISVILNGFRVQALPAATEKEPCSVIQVGHLIAQKHFDTTLRAFARLKETQPAACLTIVGHGPEQKALEQLAQVLGVSNAVRFTGQLSNEGVLAEMSRAQFFCMPSVREGFGIVYLEAMASGCITIGTEGEGIADLIESGKNGFLVPAGSPEAIVQVVEWCLAHPQEADAIRQRGKQDAMALTWEVNAKKYLALFRTLIKRERIEL